MTDEKDIEFIRKQEEILSDCSESESERVLEALKLVLGVK